MNLFDMRDRVATSAFAASSGMAAWFGAASLNATPVFEPIGELAKTITVLGPQMGPIPVTLPASAITGHSAMLNADVDAAGSQASVTFEYGTDPGLATFSTTASVIAWDVGHSVPAQVSVDGLILGKTYYFRVLASNANNPEASKGAIRSFKSGQPFPDWLADFGASGGPTGNGDGDALNNLLEYAFGTDPRTPQSDVITAEYSVLKTRGEPLVTIGENARVMFVRRLDREAVGLIYRPQFSEDLSTWTDAVLPPYVIARDAEFELVRLAFLRLWPDDRTPRFFRVLVTLP